MHQTELAAALGAVPSTVTRWIRAGMPMPNEGEALAAWALRAKAWRRATRKHPGPPTPPKHGRGGMEEFRRLKCDLLRTQVAKAKGETHSKAACEAERAKRFGEVALSFLGLGQAVARKCANQTAEIVLLVVNEEVRHRLQLLADGGLPDDGDAQEQPEQRGAGSAAPA